MEKFRKLLAVVLTALMVLPPALPAANHREAPITALDHKADITDVYSFVSYNNPNKVTLMFGVDPFLEPGNGPTWFPFDPEILYEIKVDNNHDAEEDIVFQLRFSTEQRLPGVFQSYVGAGTGIVAPANSPAPIAPGTPLVPPQIDDFNDAGLGLRQTYTLTMVRGRSSTPITNSNGSPFFVVPANVGPRTMNYGALFNAGTYSGLNTPGVSVFAGTVEARFCLVSSDRTQSPRLKNTPTCCFKVSTKSGKTLRHRFGKMAWACTSRPCLALCFPDAPDGTRFP